MVNITLEPLYLLLRNVWYYHRLSNLPGVDKSKNIFSHSHPGDNGNPEASVPDRNIARASWLPGTFQVSSKGVYKIIPRE